MDYKEHTVLPPYERIRLKEGGEIADASDPAILRWSADFDPPAIGTKILARINNCGEAVVVGYFQQGGFLGVICDLLDAPEWHRKQNNNDPRGHLFGAEMSLI